ncbi:MAG: 50S ribosomal protein L30 [Candidatus Aenigmarchaeota archaeon]|nr:50S ribosomal protein L30 [Candidatus Aenigmarchaeota archaeon]
MYAVVRVRGGVNVRKELKDTLRMLRLTRINHCVLFRKDPKIEGMIKKVKDFVTWGEISDKVLEKLVSQRGRMLGDRKLDVKEVKGILSKLKKVKNLKEIEGFKPVFRMSPPRKGYEGTKQPFPRGALGYRGEEINKLLERMM